MRGHGIAGALWSAIRRLALVPGGIRASVAVLMAVAALCMPQQAHGTIITATVTGTVASGTDADDLFGQGGTLTGDPYKIVYTIDDTKGTGTVPDYFSTPVQLGSHIYSTPTSNPITAVATINNGPPISFDIPGADTFNQVSRSILSGVSSLVFNIQESFVDAAANSAADRLSIGASSLVNAPFTTDPNWEAPLSANAPFNFFGTEGVLQYDTFNNGVATQQVSASLNISKIAIGQPVTPPVGSPTSVACSGETINHVLPGLGTKLSATDQPYEIRAAFNPPDGLMTAAADCGVTGFDWQQTITNFPPTGTFTRADRMGLTDPIYDPQPSGWTNPVYCTLNKLILPTSTSLGVITESNPSVAITTAYPFYYNPTGSAGDCGSLSSHESRSMLNFYDSPADPNLTAGEEYSFQTCLVGYNIDPTTGQPTTVNLPLSDNSCFDWTDTYTGFLYDPEGCTASSTSFSCNILGFGTGGIPAITQLMTNIPSGYPGLGSGGITLVSAPEPPGLLLFAQGVAMIFVWVRFRIRRTKLRVS